VEEVTYLGEASQYLLRAGEVSLKCLALSAAGAAGGGGLLHRGEAARVRIAPESVVLLPPDA
jgi:hypothetical protein